MNATAVIAIAGLISTAAVGLVVPIINGVLSNRNARSAKNHELRLSAYVDATAYAHAATVRARALCEPAAIRHSSQPSQVLDSATVNAKILLLAPPRVVKAWSEFLSTEDAFAFHVREEFPDGLIDQEGISREDERLVALISAFSNLVQQMRAWFDADELAKWTRTVAEAALAANLWR